MHVANSKVVIQGSGSSNITKPFSANEISKTIDFAVQALNSFPTTDDNDKSQSGGDGKLQPEMTMPDEGVLTGFKILEQAAPSADMSKFGGTAIDGLMPRLERGNLGLNRI